MRAVALFLAGLSLLILSVGACSDSGFGGLLIASPAPPADRPIEVSFEGYSHSNECRSCHPAAYDSWYATYHRTMTQVVTPETVVAEWDGVELELRGETYRLERRGDEFWAEMNDPEWDGEGEPSRVWRQIVMSTGSHHFQAYWFPAGELRKLSLFLMCWRIDEGRWMPVDSAFLNPSDHHRKNGLGRWNTDCIKCHATKGRPRISQANEMDTHVVEFGITCDACHGPGEEHIAANQNPGRRYSQHFSDEPDPTIVDPSKLKPRLATQACGQCHGLTGFRRERQALSWNKNGFPFKPGDNLLQRRTLLLEGDTYFWSDGMVRVSGREYQALGGSPCFQHNDKDQILTCYDCHQMHKDPEDPRTLEEWRVDLLKVGMDGDQACTQCHTEYAAPEEITAHTRHELGSTGSACMNCHMPHTDWALLKTSRSHQITNPNTAKDLATGRPNACNLCHLDQPLLWTAESLQEWYGIDPPEFDADERSIAASILWLLTGDAGQRAIIATSMGRDEAREASGTDWMVPYLAQLLEDPYDAVRFRAIRALRKIEGFEDLEYDFVGPAEERAEAHRLAMEIWGAMIRAETGEELLVTDDGSVRRDVFERLLKERDDKTVILAE